MKKSTKIILNSSLVIASLGLIIVGILPFCGVPYFKTTKPKNTALKLAKEFQVKKIKNLNLNEELEKQDIAKVNKATSLKILVDSLIDIY